MFLQEGKVDGVVKDVVGGVVWLGDSAKCEVMGVMELENVGGNGVTPGGRGIT